jgi:hypothetical protein
MSQNIQAMANRGEKLDTLSKQTSELENSSRAFRTSARKAKAKAFWNRAFWFLMLAVLLVVLLVVLIAKMKSLAFSASG